MENVLIIISLSSFLLVAALISAIIIFFINIWKFYNSIYHQSTKYTLIDLLDKGKRGEYLVYKKLSKKFKAGENAYYVFNAYIPSDNDIIHENECDIILIHSTGIYVIESKNHKRVNWDTMSFAVSQVKSDASHISNLLQPISAETNCVPIVALGTRCSKKDLSAYANSYNITVTTYKHLRKEIHKLTADKSNIYEKNTMSRIFNMLDKCSHKSEAFKQKHIEECQEASEEVADGKYTYQYCKSCNAVTLCVPLIRFGKKSYRCTICNRKFQLRKNSTSVNTKQTQPSGKSSINNTVPYNKSQLVIGSCIDCGGDITFRKVPDQKYRRFVCSNCGHVLKYSVPYIYSSNDICKCSNCNNGILHVTYRDDNVNIITCNNCKNRYTYYNSKDSITHK